MIKVLVRYNNSKEFESLTIKGHANSGPLGHDLVCAAISGIVLGGINNLHNKFSLTSDEKTGSLELKSLGKVSEHDNIVIETIVTQINSIARDNPKNVKISVE